MTTHQLVRGLGGVLLWLVAVPPAAARAAPQSKEFQAARGSHVITLPARAVRVQGGDHNVDFVASGYEHARRVVKGAPYSAESVTATVQTLADGNRIVREHNARVCRDSEGRTRREQTLNSIGPWASEGQPRTIIFIHDPVAGVHYVLNPEDKTARKLTLRQVRFRGKEEGYQTKRLGDHTAEDVHVERFAWVAGGEHGSEEMHDFTIQLPGRRYSRVGTPPEKESLGTRVIEGVEAEGTRITMTIPAGQIGNERPVEIVSERWYSPELQLDVLTKRQDPQLGETTYRLTNIQRVEPLPTLFEVPADYTVREGGGSM